MRKPTAYGYARASTLQQDESVKTQEQTIKDFYRANLADQYEWGGCFKDDGVSAYSKEFAERPEGGKLDRTLKPYDALIVTRHDRLVRQIGDGAKVFERLKAKKIAGYTTTGGAIGTIGGTARISWNFWSLMSEGHSQLVSDRTKEGNFQLMRRGEVIGHHCPPGYTWEATGEFRKTKKARRILKPDIESRKVWREMIIKWTRGATLKDVVSWANLTSRRAGRGDLTNVKAARHAFHCLILKWPSTFYPGYFKSYWYEARELGIIPHRLDEGYRIQLQTSLEHVQDLVRAGHNFHEQTMGCPYFPSSLIEEAKANA